MNLLPCDHFLQKVLIFILRNFKKMIFSTLSQFFSCSPHLVYPIPIDAAILCNITMIIAHLLSLTLPTVERIHVLLGCVCCHIW